MENFFEAQAKESAGMKEGEGGKGGGAAPAMPCQGVDWGGCNHLLAISVPGNGCCSFHFDIHKSGRHIPLLASSNSC